MESKVKMHSEYLLSTIRPVFWPKTSLKKYGIDFDETFIHVACFTLVHSLIIVAAIRRWYLFQIDVKNAFLNDDLEEEVYMQLSPGLVVPFGKVYHLRWVLYGLK